MRSAVQGAVCQVQRPGGVAADAPNRQSSFRQSPDERIPQSSIECRNSPNRRIVNESSIVNPQSSMDAAPLPLLNL
jgi:hypothetical protein